MSAKAQPSQPLPLHLGIVKQVLSGDSVIIRGIPKGGPPPEKQICLSNINAPKLARRPNPNVEASVESKDEPYAWEAREFLRKKLIGKEVCFTVEYKVPGSGREYGCIYLGKETNGENVTESIISAGLVEVRRGGIKPTDSTQKLCDIEDAAKSAGVGKWGDAPEVQKHVRNIKWSVDNLRNFVDSLHGKPVKAVVEHVRDGCTIRAFLCLPDAYYHTTIMMSGIRCPMFKMGTDGSSQEAEPFAEEAKYFTESRLLQRDVEIVLESVSNQNYLGSIHHPNGSIAELLLKDGFARCVDWSIAIVTGGPEKLRAAERSAKEKKVRLWKDYQPSTLKINLKDKEFQAKVVEVVNADALMVKLADGSIRKIFLSSIRPPKSADASNETQKPGKHFRPLYEVPYMFEAREFLRKKLIGKKINVCVDYIQAANTNTNSNLPERSCCTVTIGGQNVAEALVSKGLTSVVRYRQDDDQRSAHYDDLLAAEMKAQKSGRGMHSKKDAPTHKVADVAGDASKAKQFLPFLQRAGRSEGVVEFVASGSRLRIYIPRETCLITFLLAGISCPKAARSLPGGSSIEGEPFGDEALVLTKELCHQREVSLEVDGIDKAGNFIGWLWIEDVNMSVSLVDEGLASVHFSAERSSHFKALQNAEDKAKNSKKKIWQSYVEAKEVEPKEEVTERKISYLSVVITEVTPELHFFAQKVDQGSQLVQMMDQMRQEFASNPPLPGVYSPRRGDICAAKFSEDSEWYRARVERITSKGEEIHVLFMDYGNREVTDATKLASLPSAFSGFPAFAKEYALACVSVPNEADFQQAARDLFMQDSLNRELSLNVEYRVGTLDHVSVLVGDSKEDVGRGLITDGLLSVENRKERRLQKIMKEYKSAEESAKRSRLNIWRYGDFREDDAKEFGVSH